MKIDFKWKKSEEEIAYEKTGGDKARLFLANEAKRLMDPYVPFDNGVLSQNVSVYLKDNKGIVHYKTPYAHYQYTGKTYVKKFEKGNVYYNPNLGCYDMKATYKIESGRKLKYSTFRHPLATSKWDKAMYTAKKGELTKAVKKYIKYRWLMHD